MSSSGIPLILRMAHCVLPGPFFAAALLFFATNWPGFTSAGMSLSCAQMAVQGLTLQLDSLAQAFSYDLLALMTAELYTFITT